MGDIRMVIMDYTDDPLKSLRSYDGLVHTRSLDFAAGDTVDR